MWLSKPLADRTFYKTRTHFPVTISQVFFMAPETYLQVTKYAYWLNHNSQSGLRWTRQRLEQRQAL